jgi:hypothetical protein
MIVTMTIMIFQEIAKMTSIVHGRGDPHGHGENGF